MLAYPPGYMINTMMSIDEIDPGTAAELLDASGAVLLDVREDHEWAAGHAPGAVHLRLAEVITGGFEPGKPVVAVCRSGMRSRQAATRLAGSGVKVYNLAGGMTAWRAAGRPVVRNDGSAGAVI